MDTQLIDNRTGEIITADDAWQRHRRIVHLRNQLETTFLTLGEELHVFHTGKQYETLGYSTFEAYLADPEVDLSRSSAYQAIAVYRHYILNLECPTVGLLQAGVAKAELLIPYTTEDNVDEWLNKASALSRSDLRIELGLTPHVSRNTGNNEWYTPPEYIEAARCVMGAIDLDPASSEFANEIVKATTFYTTENDGLAYNWRGRVWMNPPYASDLIGLFADKLAKHIKQGDVTEACVLVNNATETGWFNTLLDEAACACFIRGRVKFIDIDGNPSGTPLQGQAILYIGPNATTFGQIFSDFGTVLYARRDQEQGKSQTT